MATDNSLRSYGDTTIREDVMPLVEILTAKEHSILNKLSKVKAIATVHETMTDELETPGSNAVAEDGDYTNKVRTTPTRLVNIIEHVAVPFRVSRTQTLIQHYHGENELARQTKKAMMEWHNSAEFDLVRSTLVSGVSGTAPKMSGIIEAVSQSTNHTAHNSGTAWSASILKALMSDNWDNSNGDVATDLYMGSFLRDKTDDFSNKSDKYGITRVKEIIETVDVYETGLGRVAVHPHRYVQQSGDATARILAINPDKLNVAMLESTFVDTGLARSGDYEARAIVGKLTLGVKNKDSNWYADGFDKD